MQNKFARLIAFIILFLVAEVAASQEPAETNKNQNIPSVDVEDETLRIRKKLHQEYAVKTDSVIHYYVIAQQLLFKGNYSRATVKIDQALEIHKNADLLALKGTILFKQNKFAEAELFFTQAFKLDKSTPLLPVDGLKEWLTEKNIIE